MKHKIEFRTTMSATPYFFRRIHFLAASIRALPQIGKDFELVICVGGGDIDNFYRSQPWSLNYPIIWRTPIKTEYDRLGYRATHMDRATHISRADFTMMVDADVMFIDDFADLLPELEKEPAICGVMAHISPFLRFPPLRPAFQDKLKDKETDIGYWKLIAENYGVKDLPIDRTYSGWTIVCNDPAHKAAPVYFNGGFILGPTDLMERMCSLYREAEDSVDEVIDSIYRPQIGRTLIFHKHGIPFRALPQRYNFPNDPGFDRFYPEEMENIVALHYQRRTVMHRDEDFSTPQGVEALIARQDLQGSNEVLRKRVEEIWPIVAEEERLSG